MKYQVLFALLFVPVTICSGGAAANVLDEHLAPLESLLGLRCHGVLGDVETSMRFEVALDGVAVRRITAARAIGYSDETLIYWDPHKEEFAFFEVTNRGHIARGVVVAEQHVYTFRGQYIKPEGITEFRNTLTLLPDGGVQDEWYNLRDGAWELGHSVRCSPAIEETGPESGE